MCGIAGIAAFDAPIKIESRELEAMVSTLTHRGPDGMDTFVDRQTGCCGLAHCRLAVIDIAGGTQPMTNEDQNLWITYNGECYNFQQLRQDMQGRGHHFKTHSDTEVVLHLYEEYGPDCVHHIRGMFAFAVWNRAKRELFLARDRLGKKPLYYAMHNGRFIFASECKAILQTQNFPRRVDPHALAHYLLYGYVSPLSCAYQDIRPMPPGHSMLIHAGNSDGASPKTYWSLPTEARFTGTFDEAVEQTRDLVTQAVQMRLVSDVPLGVFLSGGLDSTIIAGVMSQVSPQPVQSCSIGFAETRYNELHYARLAAKRFGCHHEEHRVIANCRASIEKLSYYYDEPFSDSSALPTLELAAIARPRVTVALTGDGGDECFGGYDRYRAVMLTVRMAQVKWLRRFACLGLWKKLPASEHHSRLGRLKRLVMGLNLPLPQRYLEWITVFNPDYLAELFRKEYYEIQALTGGWHQLDVLFNGSGAQHPPAHYAARAMLIDGLHYLPGDLNTKIDRASMAVGLELRSPFEDHKVVEFAYSLPPAWRHNGSAGKILLRRAFSHLLPGRIAQRRKMGFGVPVGRWFRTELRDTFVDTVLSSRARQRGYFNIPVIEQLLRNHDAKREDNGHRMWALLMLELWHQRYIDGKGF